MTCQVVCYKRKMAKLARLHQRISKFKLNSQKKTAVELLLLAIQL